MKKRVLCSKLPKPGLDVPLSDAEAHHATVVLRLKDGDSLQALDGQGGTAWVTLRTRKGPVRVSYNEDEGPVLTTPSATPAAVPIILEMAVLKGDAMEWVVEKAVELGIQEVRPILTRRTVVRMDHKSPEAFQERWTKIANSAIKQCGRLQQMTIPLPVKLEEWVGKPIGSNEFRIWCDELSQGEAPDLFAWLQGAPLDSNSTIRILIGPEGGWDPEERRLLALGPSQERQVRVSLGPHTLRAETAAIYAISVVSAHLRHIESLALAKGKG